MRTVERYRRTSYGTLEADLTITDPKIFTRPWTTKGKVELRPNAELWEYFCVPSESDDYNKRLMLFSGLLKSAGAAASSVLRWPRLY